ncbi:alkaline phosphatase D family protein [Psychromonas ossibalaenae]|uniref:alkaline phosphatase D family protein n=1 Tax=Psychromonas ossibalaenae TaxID=444922 RepID=UPI00037C659B|nr:alkaline phosphatase D family protein [Psychromonas ossibalaenae]
MSSLPLILAGPIVRKCTAQEVVFWFATSEPLTGSFTLALKQQILLHADLKLQTCYQVGRHCWITLCTFRAAEALPLNQVLNYQFITQQGPLEDLLPNLLYPGETLLMLVIKTDLDYVMHGSCRNPHHNSDDSLVAADNKTAQLEALERPALLMLSGDQIYADHVAGPTLSAIKEVIHLLGLNDETFDQAAVADSQALYQHPDSLLNRDKILPKHQKQNLLSRLLPTKEKSVFSATEIDNHLISFGEFMAMYLLVWSPQLWPLIEYQQPPQQNKPLSEVQEMHWQQECIEINSFAAGLVQVQRLFAHLPTYMIFDDHDITDDWNLSAAWEQQTYQHPFSRRIIGNGLMAYWLCQGWGNEPDNFGLDFHKTACDYFNEPKKSSHDSFVEFLFKFEQWHYSINTYPKMLVLDTRTRRWRSELNLNKPSGLMDWEALTEMQQSMINEDSIILVSPAPVFGVKFIEALQQLMTWLGLPLMVDAENWMAHKGAANVLLSIFSHRKTPDQFIILSGDVHYSFVYDIRLRFRTNSPKIYQITCSGIKNQFPGKLLTCCEFLDRILYSPYSPINFFTKRKSMKISKRDPSTPGDQRLVNSSAIGELKLDKKLQISEVTLLTGKGHRINFDDTK